MSLLLLLAVLAVLAGIALAAAGRVTSLPDAPPDRAPTGVLPPSEFETADIERLRFSLAFRGYRMDEVDDVLDRLTAELAERDARIAELEQGGPLADKDVDVPAASPSTSPPSAAAGAVPAAPVTTAGPAPEDERSPRS